MIFPSGEKEFEVLAAWARNIFLAGNVIGAGNAVGAFGPNVKDWDDNGFAAGGTTTGNSCSDTRLLESCRSLGDPSSSLLLQWAWLLRGLSC